MTVQTLEARYRAGDRRALARAVTLAEAGLPSARPLLRAARERAGRATVLGVTGSPGSGKSTLTDALIAELRARGERVAVLAVDPSSPYSGGAILGDRIRMLRHHADEGVFVRSLASRGALGGLSAQTLPVLALLDGAGFDWVILETVGVGQSEVDIAAVCDHTLLVLTPAGGDGIQAFKAGIMEIADVIAVNKADLPGAERTVRELMAAQGLGWHDEHTWFAPIRRTVASRGEGVDQIIEAVRQHREHLGETGLQGRRERRAEFEVRTLVQERLLQRARAAGADLYARVARGELDTDVAADELLRG
ncbi:methylmalonyl Co-A mutase-associated GTPase MeaB [Deinococcus radiodurans]|jgi:LAO/AO transport system ATPase|uniref:LAO/AO transport system kinase n=1 Tax=Deinococcus radiodurans (strain ATCC 13939 / DSM 20539 / JCM 16871 / CCUG 27074 / LMG 4051 / NBRC 15346 / NCIMB 9279 / VKM B-1422 / R1) TaxID=243230 RepID=Q9RTL3_DEIRA|nr:methylmalonyl Co-A mutase-associated GTPase MeaB [Deinococcus radiodurans]AAF11302.1 LAO/AO transport system kinase [Deinococcus radiodurans R1 = ATCC 13939 = DSM 20539]ANC71155.1 transporter [Deinococcus radiodurans R1 = ATCC 13939 = DSM 20539]QEM71169.1 methylmalonyl Co-A mutase-associated GTPase MeaB [Deinococcus radiodurans]QIP29715.1 methylmalonyl Co-A mutase-associated GTPase MeaB [Deinococcus radiodurans]QIP31606.1 methylmalonyl Co-A mutase-associated GTPase MeaB [Deinococcus radiodu